MSEKQVNSAHRSSAGSVPFERMSARYDQWFDSEKGGRIFRVEAACMRDLLLEAPRPWLEVGVGTGRFAEALHVDEGIDPSAAVLRYAVQRGINSCLGEGESLPWQDSRFGAVLLIVTLCFLRDPARALAECRRVLQPDGVLLLGFVPKDSAWGQAYMAAGARGHPFYAPARFYTVPDVDAMCESAGFVLDDSRSCLSEEPDRDVRDYRPAVKGLAPGAGFVGLRYQIGRAETGSGSGS